MKTKRAKINPTFLKLIDNPQCRIKIMTEFGVSEMSVRGWLKTNAKPLTQYDMIRYLQKLAQELGFQGQLIIEGE